MATLASVVCGKLGSRGLEAQVHQDESLRMVMRTKLHYMLRKVKCALVLGGRAISPSDDPNHDML